MDVYELLTGVGTVYVAPHVTAVPAVTATPGSGWVSLGETRDGVKIAISQKVEVLRTDQRTAPVKATRTEEDLQLETKLVSATLENLARFLGATVVDTAAVSGVIGSRTMPFYRGPTVAEFAVLFRGTSPYGDYPLQFYFPRCYVDGDLSLEFQKGDNVTVPMTFKLLEDLDATTGQQLGNVTAQDAAALP